MGRPKLGEPYKVRIPEDVIDDLHLIAAHEGVAVQDVIRTALRQYVKRMRSGRGAA